MIIIDDVPIIQDYCLKEQEEREEGLGYMKEEEEDNERNLFNIMKMKEEYDEEKI